MKKSLYLKSGRLEDIIRLISVLAIHEATFRTESGLMGELKKKPISAENWFAIVEEHPEFFRYNNEKTTVALLMRATQPKQKNEATNKEYREPLDFIETQELIKNAMGFHDKAVSRSQKYNYIIPSIITAILSGTVAVFTTYLTITYKNQETQKQLNQIQEEVISISKKMAK